MSKKFRLILSLLTFAIIIYFSFTLYQLVSKSYDLDESQLYKIDTFHLLDRAYIQPDNSEAAKTPGSQIVFQSTNRYGFSIGGYFYRSIKDRNKLLDTLMYHDTKFTVFSEKEVYEEYQRSKNPIFIPVYQIQIGETRYIDISKRNNWMKHKLLLSTFISFAVILTAVFFLIKDIRANRRASSI